MPSAVLLNSMGFNIARSVGPAIGGMIVATAGAAAAFAVNAASYLPLIAVLARWRPPSNPRPLPRETLGVAVAAGLRYVAMSPAIHAVLVRCAAFGVGAVRILALMPLVARHPVGGGPLTFGLLLGAFGAGAVAGALGSARLRRLLSTEAIVRAASVGFAVAAAIAGVSSYLAITMAVMLVAGAGWVLALVDLQRRGADVRPALGRRARLVDLPDGRVQRDRRRQLALGRRRGKRRHRGGAARRRERDADLRGAWTLAAGVAGRPAQP